MINYKDMNKHGINKNDTSQEKSKGTTMVQTNGFQDSGNDNGIDMGLDLLNDSQASEFADNNNNDDNKVQIELPDDFNQDKQQTVRFTRETRSKTNAENKLMNQHEVSESSRNKNY